MSSTLAWSTLAQQEACMSKGQYAQDQCFLQLCSWNVVPVSRPVMLCRYMDPCESIQLAVSFPMQAYHERLMQCFEHRSSFNQCVCPRIHFEEKCASV